MKKLVRKFGQYNVIAFSVMILGVLLFLLTPLFLWLFNFDSDIIGVLVFLIGLLLFLTGIFTRFILGRARTKKT